MRRRAFRSTLLAGLLLWARSASGAEIEYVLHISVDGLRGDLLASMLSEDPGSLPGFRRLVAEGAGTFNARTDYTHTITLPNHTCMLTGRPVLQPPGQSESVHHGYLANRVPAAGVTLHNGGNRNLTYVASVFDVVHDAGRSTALYASKKKFVLYDHSWDAEHGAPDRTGTDNGTDKIDRYVCLQSAGTAVAMQAALCADLESQPFTYNFIHYTDPDDAGHDGGWGSSAWRAAVGAVDRDLTEIFAIVDRDPRLAGHTAIVLTADHGGEGENHGQPELPAVYTIPFLVWGSGVEAGADLYVLNPATRADPAKTRPDSNATPPPIRNGDSANLVLQLLGHGPVPGSSINAKQDLAVHR